MLLWYLSSIAFPKMVLKWDLNLSISLWTNLVVMQPSHDEMWHFNVDGDAIGLMSKKKAYVSIQTCTTNRKTLFLTGLEMF